jgi:hypothetical protein
MKILRGTLFGGIAYFFLGWLIYGILLMDYSVANTNQCLNKPDGEMIWWAMIVSSFTIALLLTLILKWSKTSKLLDGLIKGCIFGLLFTVMIGTSYWSMTTMYNSFVPLIVDIVVGGIVYGLIGMVIVLTWGKNKTA